VGGKEGRAVSTGREGNHALVLFPGRGGGRLGPSFIEGPLLCRVAPSEGTDRKKEMGGKKKVEGSGGGREVDKGRIERRKRGW